MNLFIIQHGYHRRIIRAGGENVFHRWFIWRDDSYEEHIIIAWLVVQTGCDDGLSPAVVKTK